MNKSFCADKESSLERLNAWGDGKVLASERRILTTKCAGDAWDALSIPAVCTDLTQAVDKNKTRKENMCF